VLVMKKALWKSDLKFVEDVPMICVNFIVIVIIREVMRKNIGGVTANEGIIGTVNHKTLF
jgi:hypothetical protein